jgi:hypothetical protein
MVGLTYGRCRKALEGLGLRTSPALDEVYFASAPVSLRPGGGGEEVQPAPPEPRREERRLVTVLFAEFCGPAGFQGLDPEDPTGGLRSSRRGCRSGCGVAVRGEARGSAGRPGQAGGRGASVRVGAGGRGGSFLDGQATGGYLPGTAEGAHNRPGRPAPSGRRRPDSRPAPRTGDGPGGGAGGHGRPRRRAAGKG